MSDTATIPMRDQRKIVLHHRHVAERVTRPETHADPQRAAEHVEQREGGVSHRPGSRHERHERPDDRDEACQHHRHPAVLLEERMRAIEMLPVQQRMRCVAAEDPRPDEMPDAVIHGVAENRRSREQQKEESHIERPGCRDRPGRKQQRVTRQKRGDDQTGLRKDDREEQAVDPDAVASDEFRQVNVEVQEEIDQ